MPNPLYNSLGGGKTPTLPGMPGNFNQMMQQYQQFRSQFQGNPQQEVQRMLQSGKINQQQLNQAQAIAQQFQGLFR